MASQVVSSSSDNLQVLEIPSYVRGYHAYKESWTPVLGEMLLLRRDPANPIDKHAVAIFKDGAVVGHVPYNIAPRLSHFLRRDMNKAVAEVRGKMVNRGAGYGLEVPCVYRLYGPKAYIDKMKESVDDLYAAGLL